MFGLFENYKKKKEKKITRSMFLNNPRVKRTHKGN